MPCALTSDADYPDYLKSILKEIEAGNDEELKACACALRSPVTDEGCPVVDEDGKVGAFQSCVIETDSDPALLRDGFIQFYPVGVSLKQAMKWIWKSRAFTGSGSGQQQSDCCGYIPNQSPTYVELTFPKSQSTLGEKKMSEILCNYNESFLFVGTDLLQECNGTTSGPISAEAYFDFLLSEQWPIYLYDEKYYLSVSYKVGPQAMNYRDINENAPQGITYSAGNFTVDGVNFPLYVPTPECNATPQTNFTCTTSLERTPD